MKGNGSSHGGTNSQGYHANNGGSTNDRTANNSLNILVGNNAPGINSNKFTSHSDMLSLDPNNSTGGVGVNNNNGSVGRGNPHQQVHGAVGFMQIQPQSTKASTGAPL